MKRHAATLRDGTTIRLSAGAHSSPGEGVCVVELASMIAGEEFSDRPVCVCPVIGAFLRGWNDRASHAQRQRLAPYAARVVGSRANPRVTRERREMCLEWAGVGLRRDRPRGAYGEVAMRIRMAVWCGLDAAMRPDEGAGELAARAAFARGDPSRAFELLEALLSAGADRGPNPRKAASAAANGHNGHRALQLDPPPPANGSVPNELPRLGALANGVSGDAGLSNGNGSLGDGARSGRSTRATPARRAP